MNPGPVEEVGATARSFIDALKQQPATLALIVANIAMLVFMFYALAQAGEFRDSLLKQQFEYQHRTAELLARCVIPGTANQSFRLQGDESTIVPLPPDRPMEIPRE